MMDFEDTKTATVFGSVLIFIFVISKIIYRNKKKIANWLSQEVFKENKLFLLIFFMVGLLMLLPGGVAILFLEEEDNFFQFIGKGFVVSGIVLCLTSFNFLISNTHGGKGDDPNLK